MYDLEPVFTVGSSDDVARVVMSVSRAIVAVAEALERH